MGDGGAAEPVRGVRLPAHRPGRERRLEPGEEERLIEAAAQVGCPWLRSAIVLSLETALRRGALLSLRWEDVLLDRVLIRTSKNGRPRTVALSSKARAALSELPRSIDGRVFPTTAPAWITGGAQPGSSLAQRACIGMISGTRPCRGCSRRG
jgi:integrase